MLTLKWIFPLPKKTKIKRVRPSHDPLTFESERSEKILQKLRYGVSACDACRIQGRIKAFQTPHWDHRVIRIYHVVLKTHVSTNAGGSDCSIVLTHVLCYSVISYNIPRISPTATPPPAHTHTYKQPWVSFNPTHPA